MRINAISRMDSSNVWALYDNRLSRNRQVVVNKASPPKTAPMKPINPSEKLPSFDHNGRLPPVARKNGETSGAYVDVYV